MKVNKQVELCLVGIDGNAYAVLSAFRRQAKIEQWTDSEIKSVIDDAKSGDYDHLISVIMAHCVNPIEVEDE